MNLELNRRSLFRGLLAVSALRFLPAVPVIAPTTPVAVQTLNPFASGNSESLTEMVLAMMEEGHRIDTIEAIRSVPSFRIELLDDVGPDESVSNALTDHLGEGDWSEWDYSADEVRDALVSLERRDAIRIEALRYMDANQVNPSAIDATPDVSQEARPSTAA
jgi:hypothetical protein